MGHLAAFARFMASPGKLLKLKHGCNMHGNDSSFNGLHQRQENIA
ncbi:MAG: hypothetical protein V7L29_00610 [Nostoc sp.]